MDTVLLSLSQGAAFCLLLLPRASYVLFSTPLPAELPWKSQVWPWHFYAWNVFKYSLSKPKGKEVLICSVRPYKILQPQALPGLIPYDGHPPYLKFHLLWFQLTAVNSSQEIYAEIPETKNCYVLNCTTFWVRWGNLESFCPVLPRNELSLCPGCPHHGHYPLMCNSEAGLSVQALPIEICSAPVE